MTTLHTGRFEARATACPPTGTDRCSHPMRIALVSETYPPEINGVALTVQGLEHGLRARGHEVDLVRPRQSVDDTGREHELLVRGLPLPRYPGLRLGLPATGRMQAAWSQRRPDAIYVATEGPLGWSALRAARRLGSSGNGPRGVRSLLVSPNGVDRLATPPIGG